MGEMKLGCSWDAAAIVKCSGNCVRENKDKSCWESGVE